MSGEWRRLIQSETIKTITAPSVQLVRQYNWFAEVVSKGQSQHVWTMLAIDVLMMLLKLEAFWGRENTLIQVR